MGSCWQSMADDEIRWERDLVMCLVYYDYCSMAPTLTTSRGNVKNPLAHSTGLRSPLLGGGQRRWCSGDRGDAKRDSAARQVIAKRSLSAISPSSTHNPLLPPSLPLPPSPLVVDYLPQKYRYIGSIT